ncbi:hypothetical protein H2204_000373 [Knufia peltigerae]|uniref:SRPBCC family protein n=1 Tax=Knufia peltigerae TaxID=1002370 RepID=A0AA39D3C7_9EURO|nr:hypothetical protein H2204_000373 [Knufia peltigerae]
MSKPRTKIHQRQVKWDFPVEEIWSLLSSFGANKAWMPIKSCTIDGHGVGATRTVMARGDMTESASFAYETLEVLDDERHHISYRVQDEHREGLPVRGFFGNWKLESQGANSTLLTWWIDAEQVTPEAIPELIETLGPFMDKSLEGLKRALS